MLAIWFFMVASANFIFCLVREDMERPDEVSIYTMASTAVWLFSVILAVLVVAFS